MPGGGDVIAVKKMPTVKPKAASSAGGRRHVVEKYSTSYTSIAYVPDFTSALQKHSK